MKKIFTTFLLLASTASFAQSQLYCQTEKHEVDPESRMFPLAGDTNQKILMDLYNGQPVGTARLSYEFDQSQGGASVWSLFVKEAKLNGDTVTLDLAVEKSGKAYLKHVVQLKLYARGSGVTTNTQAAIVNEKLSPVDGKTLFYDINDGETLGEQMMVKLGEKVASKELARGDFAFVILGSCWLR